MNKPNCRPFGLLFEEQPVAAESIIPVYDEDEDISVIIDASGKRTPAVEYRRDLGTKTFTKEQGEGTDDDWESIGIPPAQTQTATKMAMPESVEAFSNMLGTKTETFILSEQTDKDVDLQFESQLFLATSTATKNMDENTDKD